MISSYHCCMFDPRITAVEEILHVWLCVTVEAILGVSKGPTRHRSICAYLHGHCHGPVGTADSSNLVSEMTGVRTGGAAPAV